MLSFLLALFLLEPVPASRLAAWVTGAPEADLVAIARRESQGRRIGVHAGDAWASRLACRKAKRRGWLDRDLDCRAGGYATRGAHGQMVAYNGWRVGVTRWVWLFDVPIVSAIAAARRHLALCPNRDPSWCPNRGAA